VKEDRTDGGAFASGGSRQIDKAISVLTAVELPAITQTNASKSG
jgi:hypothetical protein